MEQVCQFKTYIICTRIHTNLSTFLASWGGKAPLKNISTTICRYAKILQTNSLNVSVMSTTWKIANYLANHGDAAPSSFTFINNTTISKLITVSAQNIDLETQKTYIWTLDLLDFASSRSKSKNAHNASNDGAIITLSTSIAVDIELAQQQNHNQPGLYFFYEVQW